MAKNKKKAEEKKVNQKLDENLDQKSEKEMSDEDVKRVLEEKAEKQSKLLADVSSDSETESFEDAGYSEKTKKAIASLSEEEIKMAEEKGMSLEAYAVAKKQGTLAYRIKRARWSYGMIAPYFILFFFFTVLPVLMSIILSFTYFNMLEFPTWVGWRNYIKLFLEDDVFMIALKNTLIFAVITGPISYFLCLLFAWIINEFHGWLRAFLTLIFYAPSICGNAYLVWNLILTGDRYGYLNGILLKLGIINEAVAWLKTEKFILPCLIIVQLWLSLGTGFLSFIAGLQTVDKSLYEAAALDGVKNRWQELWYVTLPAMKPQLMFGAVMQITQSFAVADISVQLAGNPSVNYAGATVVTHLLDYGSTRFEMGYASAIATVLFLLMIGTNKLVQRVLRRVGE